MIHNIYARLSPRDTKIVDRAYDAVAKTFAAHDMLRNNMDAAERLVEAIAVFLVESNPVVKERLAAEPYVDTRFDPERGAGC